MAEKFQKVPTNSLLTLLAGVQGVTFSQDSRQHTVKVGVSYKIILLHAFLLDRRSYCLFIYYVQLSVLELQLPSIVSRMWMQFTWSCCDPVSSVMYVRDNSSFLLLISFLLVKASICKKWYHVSSEMNICLSNSIMAWRFLRNFNINHSLVFVDNFFPISPFLLRTFQMNFKSAYNDHSSGQALNAPQPKITCQSHHIDR